MDKTAISVENLSTFSIELFIAIPVRAKGSIFKNSIFLFFFSEFGVCAATLELLRVVGCHVREVSEDVLVGFVTCETQKR